MQVYLLKDLAGKGKAGQIINVNDGYGKNFIIKNGIGKAVDNAILSQMKAKQESTNFHIEQEKKAIKELIVRIENRPITIAASVGAAGKMFGSVTSTEIAAEFSKHGIELDRKNIHLTEPIRMVGSYKIKCKFAHGLEGSISLTVQAK